MTRPPSTTGLHHISVITGSSAETLEFYTEVLGLRLVKRTVNYDDQFMHHLYFGFGGSGSETLLTCFPAERGQEGRVGQPQPTATALAVPAESVDYWAERLGGDVERTERFGTPVLEFTDGMGQPLELVGVEDEGEREGTENHRQERPIPREHAIRGIHSVTLASASPFQTASVLEALGFELTGQEGDRVRYEVQGTGATVVDVLDRALPYGREGAGTAHHVAFRMADEAALSKWRELLVADGLDPSRVKDRNYFHSLYVREPGGILFEFATDGPGLTVDEPAGALGERLTLPPWLEQDREMITAQLPPLS